MTQLRQLLSEANYDDALTLVRGALKQGVTLHRLVEVSGDSTDRLRQACMLSDVLDYGGLDDLAKDVIERPGSEALRLLDQQDITMADCEDTLRTKQECWALMEWGMTLYRSASHEYQGYSDAQHLFKVALRILLMLDRHGVKCIGSLARAWYCIGLVHRQHKEYREARAAFARSVELAGDGLKARVDAGLSTASYEYNLARCHGLGIGYIAYDEALLPEARSALMIAKSLLLRKRVRFISAYIDVVHAAALMSGSLHLGTIDDGLRRLLVAYNTLIGEGEGHTVYALRAANEIAQAYLRRARALPEAEKDVDLCEAEKYLEPRPPGMPQDNDRRLAIDEKLHDADRGNRESRTYANACIIRSRIFRERKRYHDALHMAYKAKNIGGSQTFPLIDSNITIGEAAYALERYDDAIKAFELALAIGQNKSRKITAVCHLHLSRAYLAGGSLSQAADHFNQWEVLEPELDNAFLRDLGKQVRRQLIPIKEDFRIPHAVRDLNASYLEAKFHGWLAKNALARVKAPGLTKEEVNSNAGILLGGLAAATVRLWVKNDPKQEDEQNGEYADTASA